MPRESSAVAKKLHIDARMKVIDPLLSTGPSSPVRVIHWSESELLIRVPGRVSMGALVYLRIEDRVVLGEVQDCAAIDREYEVRAQVEQVL